MSLEESIVGTKGVRAVGTGIGECEEIAGEARVDREMMFWVLSAESFDDYAFCVPPFSVAVFKEG